MEKTAGIKQNLTDAGCPEKSAGLIRQLLESGRLEDGLHELRVFRCDLMEELHRNQRKVDCLDYLIRQTEKEIKSNRQERR